MFSRRIVIAVAALIATWIVFLAATFASSFYLGWLSSLSSGEVRLIQAACAVVTAIILVLLGLRRRRNADKDES
jgi:hypothetical protein